MANNLGFGTALKLGVEGTWGVEDTRTVSVRVLEVSIEETPKVEVDESLAGLDASANAAFHYLAGVDAGGNFKAVGCYEGGCGLGMLLEAALGAVSTAGGAAPYTHTHTLAAALISLSGEVLRGNSGNAEEIYGLMINKLTLSCEAGKQLMVDVEFIGKQTADRASGGSASFGTRYPILHSHLSSFVWKSVTYAVKKFTVTLDNKLARDPVLGSDYTQQPYRDGLQEILIDVELNVTNEDLYNAWRAGTTGDAVITFANTSARGLTITGHNARILSAPTPINKHGAISTTVQMRCFSDGTNLGLAVALKNSKSSNRVD